MSDSNRRAADELHDVRARIAALREQEQALRAGLISGALDTVGDDLAAVPDREAGHLRQLQEACEIAKQESRSYLTDGVRSANTPRRPDMNRRSPKTKRIKRNECPARKGKGPR